MGPLHIITNTVIQSRYSHYELARMAFAGGADVVQYRNKSYNRARDQEELKAIVTLPRKLDQYLIINDLPALAAQVGADGVHVGLEDPEAEDARNLLGEKAIVGATVHFTNELEALQGSKIDYIGVGPVFGTKSKDLKLPALGLDGLAKICAVSNFPVIAIGSINRKNAASVLQAGAFGVAILSDFCLADNPEQVARDFKDILGT